MSNYEGITLVEINVPYFFLFSPGSFDVVKGGGEGGVVGEGVVLDDTTGFHSTTTKVRVTLKD